VAPRLAARGLLGIGPLIADPSKTGVWRVPNEAFVAWSETLASAAPGVAARLRPPPGGPTLGRPGRGATGASGTESTEKFLPAPGEFPRSGKGRPRNLGDHWPQRLGTRTAQANAYVMGSRRCTLVSADAAWVSVLLPGPTTRAESAAAPQHHPDGHGAEAPLGRQPAARGHRRPHASDDNLPTPARSLGRYPFFAHGPLPDDAESAHEPTRGPGPA
jgi:hypothetical protein